MVSGIWAIGIHMFVYGGENFSSNSIHPVHAHFFPIIARAIG